MKELFFEIVKFEVEDIITTSGLINGGDGNTEGGANTGGWGKSVDINS